MEELTLVKDFTMIMVVAGAVTLLFRKLKQPPILGYLIAGLLVGPYTPPMSLVTDTHTIDLIANLGLILVFFGIGLEFNWSKVRNAGGSILFIGIFESITMLAFGYWLGILMGLSQLSALFLGNAMQITSSAIISKIFRDNRSINSPFVRIALGSSLIEDFISIAIFAILTEFATTGTADLNSLGMFSLQLMLFVVVLVVLGSILIPKVMRFTQQFHSKEALLITSLALCFASAIFGQFLGLSVAIGAFIMGSLIGDTRSFNDVTEVITPVRQVFGAIFFVTMGMLIDISLFREFIVPSLIVIAVFVAGKIIFNTIAVFLAGYDGRTALNAGMSMPQMGEFSLVIMKVGIEKSAAASFLYPVVAFCTVFTCFTTPYLMKSADTAADLIQRISPAWLKIGFQRAADYIQAFHAGINQDSVVGYIVKHTAKIIGINLLIIILLVGLGTLTLQFMDGIAAFTGLEVQTISIIMSILLLIVCLPSFIIILRNVRSLIDEGIAHMLNRQLSIQRFGVRKAQKIIRYGMAAALTVFIVLWFIPFMAELFSHGLSALMIPLMLLIASLITYFAFRFGFSFHGHLERTVSRAFLGEEHQSASTKQATKIRENFLQKLVHNIQSIIKGKK